VLWGFWVRENDNVRNIRYYIVQGIVNEVTRELLAWIMLNKGEFATWPGHTFSMGSEEGRALLGMVNPHSPPVSCLPGLVL
jgi:hypothetical protein